MTADTNASPISPLDHVHPVVISEHNHPIRVNMIDRDAIYVMRKLNKAGFASYLVGGGVRDLYLGRTPKDFDISTNAKPGQIRKLFPNSATIGRRFRLVQVFFNSGKIIEISTLRSLSEHDLDGPEAVLAPNNTYGNLPEDAQRRDLSINSLFYDLEQHAIIDYVGGVSDLDNSIIRVTGEPDTRFNRDPVRMLRAIRHSARIQFRIDQNSWDSICRNYQKITLCPPSRIRDELFKDLYGGASANWFDLAVKSDLFFAIFPLYNKVMYNTGVDQTSPKDKLTKIFSLLDLIHESSSASKTSKLPQHFLLALILLPWAELRFDLSSIKLKGATFYKLTRKVRNEIDKHLGSQLNLRKSIRQEMTTLLCNLPNIVRLERNNTWPKWLKKKSYFKNSLLFFHFHNASLEYNEDSEHTRYIIEKLTKGHNQFSQKHDFSNRKTTPAFSSKKKGGIFGFKK